jgi:hypothetical protein
VKPWRDDPEWQHWRAEWVREDGTAAERWERRSRAIPRLFAIESTYEEDPS